jgi:hypothetical protein
MLGSLDLSYALIEQMSNLGIEHNPTNETIYQAQSRRKLEYNRVLPASQYILSFSKNQQNLLHSVAHFRVF